MYVSGTRGVPRSLYCKAIGEAGLEELWNLLSSKLHVDSLVEWRTQINAYVAIHLWLSVCM